MGFLLGAYGKLAAGSRYRSLQARMMRIQSRLRRASRDVANMEKMIDRETKRAQNAITMQAANAKQLAMNNLTATAGMQEVLNKIGGYTQNGNLQELSQQERTLYAGYQQGVQSIQAMSEMSAAQMKQQVEDMAEQMREQMLEPLKQEEDSLQLEKDSLETQLETAKLDYEACKKMEQTDAQMFKPDYTGGQG
ncbi:hypothetical protein J6G99_06430 [bacterium]|nr:hypothetical protein [bacterium]